VTGEALTGLPLFRGGRAGHNAPMRWLVSLAFVLFGGGLLAQAPKSAADLAKLGPQVGARVPEFSLPDQDGRVRSLASLLGRNGTMLVFFRSADW